MSDEAVRIRITARRACHEGQLAEAVPVAHAYHFEMVSGTMEQALDHLRSTGPKPAWMEAVAPSTEGVMFDFGGCGLVVGDEVDMSL